MSLAICRLTALHQSTRLRRHICAQIHSIPHKYLFPFLSSDRERTTTIIIIHHTTVRAEPGPMTAIQGGEQRPSDSPPTPLTGGSATTQTPLMGGLPLAAALSATRQPLLVPHKAIGGATTQTRTTNILPTPRTSNSKTQKRGHKSLQQLHWPSDFFHPKRQQWPAGGDGSYVRNQKASVPESLVRELCFLSWFPL